MTTPSLFELPKATRAVPHALTLEFRVIGIPVPQGSAKAIVSKSTGRAMLKRDDSKLLPWRQDLGRMALAARAAGGLSGVLIDGPVRVVLRFRMPRRKKHRQRTRLGDAAVRPDVDKLTRAAVDAMTNVVYGDDGQITTLLVSKRVARPGEPPGVDVAVGPDEDASYE